MTREKTNHINIDFCHLFGVTFKNEKWPRNGSPGHGFGCRPLNSLSFFAENPFPATPGAGEAQKTPNISEASGRPGEAKRRPSQAQARPKEAQERGSEVNHGQDVGLPWDTRKASFFHAPSTVVSRTAFACCALFSLAQPQPLARNDWPQRRRAAASQLPDVRSEAGRGQLSHTGAPPRRARARATRARAATGAPPRRAAAQPPVRRALRRGRRVAPRARCAAP